MEAISLSEWVDFSISPAYAERYPGVSFGLTLVSDCKPLEDSVGFEHYRRNCFGG